MLVPSPCRVATLLCGSCGGSPEIMYVISSLLWFTSTCGSLKRMCKVMGFFEMSGDDCGIVLDQGRGKRQKSLFLRV